MGQIKACQPKECAGGVKKYMGVAIENLVQGWLCFLVLYKWLINHLPKVVFIIVVRGGVSVKMVT